MSCKLMSNGNKVASFSRLRNEHMSSNILIRKGREIQHPLHREIEKKNYSCCRIRPGPDSNRRPLRRQARRLAHWAIRPSWPPLDKCLYDSQPIVSALAWKCLRKPCTEHQKVVDIFQSGAKWQKTNVFPIENTLSIILIHNRMVMSGDVIFPGLRNFAFCFFPFGVYSGMKRAHEGEIKSLLVHFFAVNL